MARFYTEISKEDFLKKVKSLIVNEDEDSDDGFPWEMPAQIGKDLSKVSFDWENWTGFEYGDRGNKGFADYPVGYRELKPGFHVFFMNAGGDWEFPICFIFYWGDNKLRAYIPENGNAWNKKEKCAYGSEDMEQEMETEEIYQKEVSEEKMIDEIVHHIAKK